MKLFKSYILLALISTILGCQNTNIKNNSSEPSAPPGFNWYKSSQGIGSFLKPNGWHIKEEKKGNTNALFISKENIETVGSFKTGLSVNQINSWSSSQTTTPSNYAKSYAAKIATTGQILKQGTVKGNFPDMHVVRVKGNNKGVSTIVHHISIGMDTKNQVYIMSYEAPEAVWEKEMQRGGPMLNYFILDN